jgi:hypothetical protein
LFDAAHAAMSASTTEVRIVGFVSNISEIHIFRMPSLRLVSFLFNWAMAHGDDEMKQTWKLSDFGFLSLIFREMEKS